ncbi:hypothetical protein PCE1_002327 [Barthelona sp. PCE]
MSHIHIAGRVLDAKFQAARIAAEAVVAENTDFSITVTELFSSDSEIYHRELCRDHKNVEFEEKGPWITVNGKFYTNLQSFTEYLSEVHAYDEQLTTNELGKISKARFNEKVKSLGHHAVAFKIKSTPDGPRGMMVLEMFGDRVPKSCAVMEENFKSYKRASVIRVVQGAWCEFLPLDEFLTDGYIQDEDLGFDHNTNVGLVGWVNNGRPHTNTSRIYVTANRIPGGFENMQVFGRVIEGLSIIRDICSLETTFAQVPLGRTVSVEEVVLM